MGEQSYSMPGREVPVLVEADVVVVGRGFSGVCAAVAARGGTPLREVAVLWVQEELRRQGATM